MDKDIRDEQHLALGQNEWYVEIIVLEQPTC